MLVLSISPAPGKEHGATLEVVDTNPGDGPAILWHKEITLPVGRVAVFPVIEDATCMSFPWPTDRAPRNEVPNYMGRYASIALTEGMPVIAPVRTTLPNPSQFPNQLGTETMKLGPRSVGDRTGDSSDSR